MADLLPLPRLGESFVDARGGERTMRVSVHSEQEVVVFSVWAGQSCRASGGREPNRRAVTASR